MISVVYSELEDAFDFVSSAYPYEAVAYVSRETGDIYWVSDLIDEEDQEVPDDIDDPDRYIQVPHKNDLDLGKKLVTTFVRETLPNSLDEVERIFRRAGAYGRFKDLLESRQLLDTWYAFEKKETRLALEAWCAQEDIEIIEETSN